VLLLCPAFTSQTRAAAQAIGSDAMALAVLRCVEDGSGFEVLVEHVVADESAADAVSRHPGPRAAPAEPEPFRTGLSEADLGLTPEERREFE
jgi:hypothetical protein